MTLKAKIRDLPLIGTIARMVYRSLNGTHRKSPSYWLPKILCEKKGYVVQIGSNDGQTGDPLHDLLGRRKNWSALFVEPVPFVFERLRDNYSGDSRFSFENSVINDGSNVTFYWVSEEAKEAIPNLKSWYDQLGGFSRSHITDHLPEVDPYIEQADIQGITLGSLLEKHGIEHFDVLHIDTEGADFTILSQLDLSKYLPEVILYERKHLSQQEEEESIRFLQGHYTLYKLGVDILAVKTETNEAMKATLNPLRSLRIADL